MSISDDDLRKELGKYMDSVPPVTGSTRSVLLSKLKKLQLESGFEGTQVDEPIEVEKISSIRKSTRRLTLGKVEDEISNEPHISSSLHKTTLVEPLESKKDNLLNNYSSSSSVFDDGDYRVRRFPPTIIPEYPSGIPVFRRRSLHPALSDPLPDPYEEIILRSPRALARLDAQRIISRVMGSDDGNNDLYSIRKRKTRNFFPKMPNLRSFLDILIYGCSGILGLLFTPFSVIHLGLSRLSVSGCRTISLLLLVCCLVVGAVFFFYADPFFHNPVTDFAADIAEPLVADFFNGGK